MLHRVTLVRTDVSEESMVSINSITTFCWTSYIVFFRSVLRLLVTAKVAASSPILFILMMKAIRSSDTSILTRTKQSKMCGFHGGVYEELRLL
jgi:multisubunit Na+/H+ antiporter MnhC subunit